MGNTTGRWNRRKQPQNENALEEVWPYTGEMFEAAEYEIDQCRKTK